MDYEELFEQALKVLEPFAAMAKHYPPKATYGTRPHTGPILAISTQKLDDAEITVEHLRAAERLFETLNSAG